MAPEIHDTRWVSWAAVSSEEQAERISLEQQAADNLAATQKHDGRLVATLTVPGHTRYYALLEDAAADMEAYRELRDLIRRRAFDVLVFRDITRLGRTAALCMAVMEICRQADIVLYATSDPPYTLAVHSSHSDMLIGAIHSVGAQEEVHRLRDRQRWGMLGRVQKGENAGAAPYGYILRYNERGISYIEIDEQSAAVVREVFRLYLTGAGVPTIVKTLNNRGVPSPDGKLWFKGTIHQMIRRAWKYAGWSELNRFSRTKRPYVRARGRWQPIISEAIAERAHQEKTMRAANRNIPDHPYVLTAVCWCGDCGRAMTYRTRKPNETYDYPRVSIVCERCRPRHSVNLPVILSALEDEMEALADLDIGQLPDEDDPLQPLRLQVEAQANVRARLEEALARTHRAYALGRMTESEYGALVDDLRHQMNAATSETARLNNAIAQGIERGTRAKRLEEVARDGKAILRDTDVVAANVWLRNHVRVTIWSSGDLRIDWT